MDSFSLAEQRTRRFSDVDQAALFPVCSSLAAVKNKKMLREILPGYLSSLYDFARVAIFVPDKTEAGFTLFFAEPTVPEHYDASWSRELATLFSTCPAIPTDSPIPLLVHQPENPKHSEPALLIRLFEKNEVIGAAVFWAKHADGFTTRIFQLLRTLAPFVSTAVSTIQFIEATQQAMVEKVLLLKVNKDISMVRGRSDLQNIINNHLRSLVSFSRSLIVVVNRNDDTCVTFLTDGESKAFPDAGSPPRTLPSYCGFIKDSLKRKESYVVTVTDIKDDKRLPAFMKKYGEEGIRQLVVVPLSGDLYQIGSLLLFSEHLSEVTASTLRLLNAVGAQISLAVSNLMMSEAVERTDQEKSMLLSFSNELSLIKNRPELKTVFKKYLRDHFHIDAYIITINNEDGKTFSYLLHDQPAQDPDDEGFKIITGTAMPIKGSMTGAVLQQDEPRIFNLADVKRKYSLPSTSFWNSVGAREVMGTRLKVSNKDIGILWTQPNATNTRLLTSVSAQLALVIANVIANEKIESHLDEMRQIKKAEEEFRCERQDSPAVGFDGIIGCGDEMKKVFSRMTQVADTNSTVLILGETGTGKELIARGIHETSSRKNKPLIKVNCAAIPANLIESELFGHEKGSFTGATDRRLGKFELAHNGTLFLDEVGEMPPDLQVKLLRALQEREIERVGGNGTIKVDVRIIAATNRNLQKEVQEGRFRADLFYRLNVFPITVPPLRNRVEDIPKLTKWFIARLAKSTGRSITHISPKALKELMTYNWPGNVRELEHLLERCILMARGDTITEIEFPFIDRKELMNAVPDDFVKSLDDNERDYIISVLRKCKGKVFGFGGAAERLGINPSTLNSRIIKLGINKSAILSS